MTVSANTIQLDDTTLSLPNTGDREITKTQVKGYKVWIAALEASFNEAIKSEKGSKMGSLSKEVVYTLWQCHKMHNFVFPANRMLQVLSRWSESMMVNQDEAALSSVCENNPVLTNSLLFAATFCEDEEHQNLQAALSLYEMALCGYRDPKTLQDLENLFRIRMVPLETVLNNTGLAAKRAGAFDKAERYYLEGFETQTLRLPWGAKKGASKKQTKALRNMKKGARKNALVTPIHGNEVWLNNLQYLYGGILEIDEEHLVIQSSPISPDWKRGTVEYRVAALRAVYRRLSAARPHIINPRLRDAFAGMVMADENWTPGKPGGVFEQFRKMEVHAKEEHEAEKKAGTAVAKPMTWKKDEISKPEKGKIVPPRECEVCLRKMEKIKFCSGCKAKAYCSTECQRSDWKVHRAQCKIASKAAKSLRKKL